MTIATVPAQPELKTEEAPLNKGFITISIMLATIMQALDTTIANVALPHMQGELSATQDQISWVLTSYIIAAAVMTAPTGVLAAKLGRKRLFLGSVIGFTVSSMLCGIAQSLPEMVLFRLLQGVFGAGLVPLSQAILLDINPPKDHGKAMAMWGVGVMLGPILGPTIGGWLTESYNWRWVFFINLPIGIMAALGIIAFLPETVLDKARKFDILGFTLLSLFLCGVQLMLDRGQSKDWFSEPEIVIEGLVAFCSFYMFITHILTAKKPFIDPAMFKDRNYSFCLIFIFIIGIILLSTMALLPPYLENLMGYPVATTGIVLAPRGIGTMVAMMLVGRLLGKIDVRIIILGGLLMTAYSLYQMSLFNLDISQAMLTRTGLLQGFGMGFVFVPLSTIAYATLPKHFRNDATAIFSLVRNIGSSIGISIMMTLLARFIQTNHLELGGRLSPMGSSRAMLDVIPQTAINVYSTQGLAILDGIVNQQAATIAYLNDFRIMMFVVLAAVPLLPLLKVVKRQKAPVDLAAAME